MLSERPPCGQPFPQSSDRGHGFPDFGLRQVLAQLLRRYDQLLVHSYHPAPKHLGGGEQKARDPEVATLESAGFISRGQSTILDRAEYSRLSHILLKDSLQGLRRLR